MDDYTHRFEEIIADEKKQQELESVRLIVMRFADIEVIHDINNVLRTIEHYILNFEDR